MTEEKFDNPITIAEEIKRLDVDMANAKTLKERDVLAKRRLLLSKQRFEMNRGLDAMSQRMHEAAEEAERSGVGTGGKGSPPD